MPWLKARGTFWSRYVPILLPPSDTLKLLLSSKENPEIWTKKCYFWTTPPTPYAHFTHNLYTSSTHFPHTLHTLFINFSYTLHKLYKLYTHYRHTLQHFTHTITLQTHFKHTLHTIQLHILHTHFTHTLHTL